MSIRILVGHIGTAIFYFFTYLEFRFVISIFKNPQLPNIKYIKNKKRCTNLLQRDIKTNLGKMVARKKIPGKMVAGKIVPEKLVLGKSVRRKLGLGNWSPEKWSPENYFPEKWFRKTQKQKIVG